MARKKQSDDVIVEITGSVYDASGILEGRVPMPVDEAARLVSLGVARYVDEGLPADNAPSSIGSEIPPTKEPSA